MKRRKRLRRKELKKRNKKIILSSILLILILSVGYASFQTIINLNITGKIKRIDFYVSSSGSDENGNGTKENPYATIQKAYNEANKVATIYIMNDIRPTTQTVFDKDKTITMTTDKESPQKSKIIKDANYQTQSNIYKDYLISIKKGTLLLKNITLYGSDIPFRGGGLLVYNNATLELKEETTITNFYSSNSNGPAIRVQPIDYVYIPNNYNLIINGATISNNTTEYDGGAIYICFNSKGIIYSSEIINNSSNSGGAIYTLGLLDIYNGTIANNQTSSSGGAIGTQYYSANGYEFSGEINIYGNPLISNNTAANVGGAIALTEKTKLTMNGGIIKNNTANTNGGIYKDSTDTVNYNSGIICENTPANEYETHISCPT